MTEELTLLLSIAAAQGGVITRRQARERGCSEAEIDRWIAKGYLRALWRGILTFNSEPPEAEGRHRELAIAVSVVYAGRLVVSHHSALVVAGLPTYGVDLATVRLTRLNKGDSLLSPPVRITRSSAPVPTYECEGARVIGEAAAIVQVAADYGIEAAVVPGDAALHRESITRDELMDAVALLRRGSNQTRARQAIGSMDGSAESPGESLLRLLVRRAGIDVEPQFLVEDDERVIARADFRIGGTNVLIEFDGKLKYGSREALFAEKRREDALRDRGWRVVRVVWDELKDPVRLIARIRSALQEEAKRA